MLKIYNTLTKEVEPFKPIKGKKVGMYSCGPTVYWYQHIGNFRTMLLNDLLKRSLQYLGYNVDHVMNITDVDDKTIRGSKKENISLKELTRKYEKIFLEDLESLNIIKPKLTRATENIDSMVSLIKKLMKKGYAYKTSDGIYFSIEKFKNYGKLANLDKVKKTKSRIIADEYDKSSPQDFALWKFYSEEDGNVFWETEIGKGRPGWHIECSAMSTKYLGDHFDIHTGAIDLIFPHHTNEIAQSEAATGKKFVNHWVHGEFLNMGDKMSKSKGNILTLSELKNQGYSPIHFRYLCLLTHYRKAMNFSYENLEAAKNAYERLKRKVIEVKKTEHKSKDLTKEYDVQFLDALNDDINIPQAVQVVIKLVDDANFSTKPKLKLLERFDSILGLGIKDMKEEKFSVTKEIKDLVEEREKLRKDKLWPEADIIRQRVKEKGYDIKDTPEGPKIEKL